MTTKEDILKGIAVEIAKGTNTNAIYENSSKERIKSRWIVEKGDWDNRTNHYVNRTKEVILKDIEMVIIEGTNGRVLRFIGGPTGYECYYVSDLLVGDMSTKNTEICICSGTINKWPTCFVKRSDVMRFLKKETSMKTLLSLCLDKKNAFIKKIFRR